VFAVSGFSFAGSGQNMGFAFIKLKPWDERKGPGLSVTDVAARPVRPSPDPRCPVFAFAPPAVSELGNATGFDLMLKDEANLGHAALMQARNQLLGGAQDKRLVAVRPNGLEDTRRSSADVDTDKAGALGVAMSDINDTIATAWGSSYVNDFIDKGRVKKVMLQADAHTACCPRTWTAGTCATAPADGALQRLLHRQLGLRLAAPGALQRRAVHGNPRHARRAASSGEAMAIVEAALAKMPPGIGYEWTGLSLQEKASSGKTGLAVWISILIVFLAWRRCMKAGRAVLGDHGGAAGRSAPAGAILPGR
jgi:HAE1 family hydrophobic/amphiphilic exporter-1/multidrug efflux pump